MRRIHKTRLKEVGERWTDRGIRYSKYSCRCGKTVKLQVSNVRTGRTKSCGCLYKKVKHGRGKTAEYRTWKSMLARCRSKKNASYKHYGSRGIKVCRRWQSSFLNFYADMGPRPKGMTLERKDNNGNYEPGNCRWATTLEQNRNHSRNLLLTIKGRAMLAIDWSKEPGAANYDCILKRKGKYKWPDEKAVFFPIRKQKNNAKKDHSQAT